MRTLLVVAALVAATSSAQAQATGEKVVLNKTKDGIALAGYDPVTYFDGAGPRKGSSAFTASYLGGTYYFVSAPSRDAFLAQPSKYAPQFGGYCGYGASRGYLAPVDPEAFTIMNGRLILQNSKSVLELWQKDPENRLKMADANWPKIVEKEGKPLP